MGKPHQNFTVYTENGHHFRYTRMKKPLYRVKVPGDSSPSFMTKEEVEYKNYYLYPQIYRIINERDPHYINADAGVLREEGELFTTYRLLGDPIVKIVRDDQTEV